MNLRHYRTSKKTATKWGWFIGALFAVVIFLLACAGSWIITCGVIKLITLCFGWTFNWGTATGIWLLMCLARTVLNHTVTVKK